MAFSYSNSQQHYTWKTLSWQSLWYCNILANTYSSFILSQFKAYFIFIEKPLLQFIVCQTEYSLSYFFFVHQNEFPSSLHATRISSWNNVCMFTYLVLIFAPQQFSHFFLNKFTYKATTTTYLVDVSEVMVIPILIYAVP